MSHRDTHEVFDLVLEERDRQDRKWRPLAERPPLLDGTGRPGDRHLADHYRAVCQAATPETDNWRDVLAEEVFEAFAETEPQALFGELIQVAAVAVAWMETMRPRLEMAA